MTNSDAAKAAFRERYRAFAATSASTPTPSAHTPPPLSPMVPSSPSPNHLLPATWQENLIAFSNILTPHTFNSATILTRSNLLRAVKTTPTAPTPWLQYLTLLQKDLHRQTIDEPTDNLKTSSMRQALISLCVLATRCIPRTAATRHSPDYLGIFLTLSSLQEDDSPEDAEPARAIFKQLQAHRIGQALPAFWTAWADLETRIGRFDKAVKLRALGAACQPSTNAVPAATPIRPASAPPLRPARRATPAYPKAEAPARPPQPLSQHQPATPSTSLLPASSSTTHSSTVPKPPFVHDNNSASQYAAHRADPDVRQSPGIHPSVTPSLPVSSQGDKRTPFADLPPQSRDNGRNYTPVPASLSKTRENPVLGTNPRSAPQYKNERGPGRPTESHIHLQMSQQVHNSSKPDSPEVHRAAVRVVESHTPQLFSPSELARHDEGRYGGSPHNVGMTSADAREEGVRQKRNQPRQTTPYHYKARGGSRKHAAPPEPPSVSPGSASTASACTCSTSERRWERGGKESCGGNGAHGGGSRQGRSSLLSMMSQKNVVHVNGRQYLMLGQVGRGGSSTVYRVLNDEMQTVALKKVKVSTSSAAYHKMLDSYANEIKLLKKLRGEPNIVQLHDAEVIERSGTIQLIMEYGDTDLAKVLLQKKMLNDNFRRVYWQQMLEAVHAIHEARIVHGDLKPANFIIVAGRLKLIDFGIAKAIQTEDTTKIVRESQVGTPNYMSPEALVAEEDDEDEDDDSGDMEGRQPGKPRRYRVGRASDIWSLGCILYQLVYGRTPFAHIKNTMQKLMCIQDPKHEITFKAIENEQMLEVLHGCLQRTPTERMTIPHLLQHPFLCPERLARWARTDGTGRPEQAKGARARGREVRIEGEASSTRRGDAWRERSDRSGRGQRAEVAYYTPTSSAMTQVGTRTATATRSQVGDGVHLL